MNSMRSKIAVNKISETSTTAMDHTFKSQRGRVWILVKPKIIEPLWACKTLTQFINSIFRYSFLENLMSGKATPICKHPKPKIIDVYFSLPEFVSACKKIVYSIKSCFW